MFVRDTLGPQLGVRVDAVEATVRCETDARGLLGIGGAAPDLGNIGLDVTIQSPDGDAGVTKIADMWQQRCPIFLALVKPTEVSVQFQAA